MQRIKGFTLIELLVVISIIALLVGILLPALGAARRTAISAKCLSNHKQIGIAITSYQADYKDHFPNKIIRVFLPSGLYKGSYNATQTWLGSAGHYGAFANYGADVRYLNPYVGGPYADPEDAVPVSVCPADEQQDTDSIYYDWGTSYRANTGHARSLTHNNLPGDNEQSGRLIDEVTNTSKTIAMFESEALEAAKDITKRNLETNPLPDNRFWHTKPGDYRFNTSFCDGHAAMITFQENKWATDDYTFNIDDFPTQPLKTEDILP